MLIEILLFVLIGILFGTITGLTPGIHVNLIGSLLVSLNSIIYLNPIYALCLVISMAITHTFIDFIPSVFLGCPDTDTELSILPSHALLKRGRGYEAINLSNKGSLIAIFLTIIILFPSIFILKKFYGIISKTVPYLLIIILLIMILTEKKKLTAILIIILSGLLGIGINFFQINEPLLPLLTGLFGASNIIISLKNKTKIPKQIITKQNVSLKKPIIGSLISAPLCSFLPGMGAGQAAVISNNLIKNTRKQFLVLVGIINTLVMSFSFISLYVINKTRTGAALTIKTLLPNLTINEFILIVIVIIISGTIAYKLTDKLSTIITEKFEKINYKTLSKITLLLIITIVLLISGPLGLIILTLSTSLGIYTIKSKTKRTNMMASLIIPTILWSFGVKV